LAKSETEIRHDNFRFRKFIRREGQ
jgi:hypothetical protein